MNEDVSSRGPIRPDVDLTRTYEYRPVFPGAEGEEFIDLTGTGVPFESLAAPGHLGGGGVSSVREYWPPHIARPDVDLTGAHPVEGGETPFTHCGAMGTSAVPAGGHVVEGSDQWMRIINQGGVPPASSPSCGGGQVCSGDAWMAHLNQWAESGAALGVVLPQWGVLREILDRVRDGAAEDADLKPMRVALSNLLWRMFRVGRPHCPPIQPKTGIPGDGWCRADSAAHGSSPGFRGYGPFRGLQCTYSGPPDSDKSVLVEESYDTFGPVGEDETGHCDWPTVPYLLHGLFELAPWLWNKPFEDRAPTDLDGEAEAVIDTLVDLFLWPFEGGWPSPARAVRHWFQDLLR